jgi:hypothetical protein
MKRADTLSSQPSASSSKAKKGGLKSLTAQQAKDVVQAAWGASQFSDHMGAGYGELLLLLLLLLLLVVRAPEDRQPLQRLMQAAV